MEAHFCATEKKVIVTFVSYNSLFVLKVYIHKCDFFRNAKLILLILSGYSEKNSQNSELGRKKSDLQDINPDLCNVKLRATKYRIARLYLENFEFRFCNPENKKSEL